MYFPGDPLLACDPIFNCTEDEAAKGRLVSSFDWETTLPGYALGYRFDIVLGGRESTPLEPGSGLVATTSQTVGPFFSLGLDPLAREDLASAGAAGERVSVHGRVLDADGEPVSDALVELWQANAHGRYRHPEDPGPQPLDSAFQGHGRVATDAHGRYRFTTVKPGARGTQAPHIAVSVFARGLQKRLVTRLYFPGDARNATDPALGLVDPERRATLVAADQPDGSLRWDIRLQGAGETVFFEC
jgi:protocatechuate 3,4-dioxygenase alpha subunit